MVHEQSPPLTWGFAYRSQGSWMLYFFFGLGSNTNMWAYPKNKKGEELGQPPVEKESRFLFTWCQITKVMMLSLRCFKETLVFCFGCLANLMSLAGRGGLELTNLVTPPFKCLPPPHLNENVDYEGQTLKWQDTKHQSDNMCSYWCWPGHMSVFPHKTISRPLAIFTWLVRACFSQCIRKDTFWKDELWKAE